jgi:hypothetical protein
MTTSNTHTPVVKQTRVSKSARGRPLMKARFTELVALNFAIDPAVLEPRVPKGLELDFYKNETYVSLVAMMLRDVRVYGVPVHIAKRVGEFNLRFYVRRKVGEGKFLKGSCFLKDYVSSGMVAWSLSKLFRAEFFRKKMKWSLEGFNIKDDRVSPSVDYQWEMEKDHWNQIRVVARERVKRTGPETKVGFILNHSNIYSRREGMTFEYPVVRPRWSIWNAGHANFTCDVNALFGPEFVKPLARRPASVFLANGSEVVVYRPNIIT